jgi:hypothetical protein
MADRGISSNTEKCIWCGTRNDYSIEHIIPEALGCPDWFVLHEGVCTGCNSAHGTLDNALLKPFEPITFLLNIPRKENRSPTITSHSTFAGYHDESGPHLFFNRENYRVELPNGKKLGPTSKPDVVQDFSSELTAEKRLIVSFTYRMDLGRNAVRALFKIALESIAFCAGLDIVRQSQFDPIRDFVLRNTGNFRSLLIGHSIWDQSVADIGDDGTGVVEIGILGHRFVCDFDPNFRNGENLIACGRMKNQWYANLPNS